VNSNDDAANGESRIPWYLTAKAAETNTLGAQPPAWLRQSGLSAASVSGAPSFAPQLETSHSEAMESENDIVLDTPSEGNNQEALFLGDMGRLKGETRRVLVQLLSGPSVDGRRQPQLWAVLLRDRRDIAALLNELFLELVIDTDQRVAFIRQASGSEDDDLPILLRRQPLSFIESALVLHLRHRLIEADRADERAVIDQVEILEYLKVFERAANNDGSGFGKQCQAAIEKVKALSLLRKIRGSEGRFEISPTLKLLFSAEEVIALTAAYEKLKTGPVTHDVELHAEGDEIVVDGESDEAA
jgi:Domain of unknown function (DUF4194)